VAHPPAAVERTFKRAGQLQLHRLRELARFYCVRCQQDKTNDYVATINGDWSQAVCKPCYRRLAREQRKDVKTVQPEIHPVQAKQPSRTVKLKHPKVKPPQPTEIREPRSTDIREQQLQRQLPGVDRLFAFFRAAGVRVEVERRGCLRINGKQTPPLRWTLPSPKTLDWNNVIDEMALNYVGGKFIRAVEENARFGEGLRAFLRPHLKGFAIVHGGVRLATICATHAQIPHREVIYANFLMPGSHWQQVADVLHSAEPELVAEWKREQETKAAAEASAATEVKPMRAAGPRRIDQLPDDLAPELISACLGASQRIRLERQVAYERPVVLECNVGELTLLPITGTGARLLLPFRLIKGTETLKGELVLGDSDPLPLLIGADISDADAITAWTCALFGFADATCIEIEVGEPTARREPTRPRWRPPSSVSSRRYSTRTLPRKRPWPSHLEPVGHWIPYSGSFVAGHRRRLHNDQTASAEARDRARQVGIVLHLHETWVRPHARGVPDGLEMRFLWHAPAELEFTHRDHSRGEGKPGAEPSPGHRSACSPSLRDALLHQERKLAGHNDRLSASSTPAVKVSPSPIVPAGRRRCGAGTQVACHPSSSASESGRSSV
jgi:hypothetical protein